MQNASELKTANPSAALSPDALRLKQQLKLLYKTQNTLPKLIEDSTIPEQNMDEYYVQLQMLLDNGAEKEDIKSSQLFDAVGKQAVPRKVLIIGKAGVGKTTFLHHLSYDWATERSFSEKYDYVFKVKLKLLLNKGKESNFYDVNHGQRLAKLIHMSIDDQQGELRTKFREAANKMQPFLEDKDVALSRLDIASIIEALGSARTLLLLDGYDELAVSKEMSEEILNLMAEIKRYDIVMTSRPNALAVNDQKDFDRLIEATGLNKEGALTYIETYFSKKEALTQVFFKDFIEKANIFKTAEEEQSNTELDIQIKRQAKAISDKGNREALGLIRKVIADLNQAEEQEEKESSRKSAALVKTLTKEVIIGRISRYYGDIKESLGNLLRMNPSLEEMITTPINTAMLCLISDNTKALKRLEKDINAGVLYQESILWLAKRYVQKRADLEPLSARVKISAFEKAEDSFMLTEMKVLKDLAYSEFIKGNVIIKGAAIESIAREQFGSMGKIDQVNEFGLLKPETFGSSTNNKDESEEESEIDELNEIDAQDLKKIDHSFIHLSFQEYLSAYFLKEQLASETQELAQKAALFIARHRSEPRYLMTLKFLSGIVTNDPSEKARLVQLRFLDAISCNIDGLIELGMEKKVILLMHIMAQVNESLLLSPAAGGTANLAKQEELKEKIQTKIQGIKDFIDIEILKDLSKWSNAVIASHYLSDKIINQVKLMIEGGGREAEIKKLSHNNEPVKPSENQEDEGLVIQVRNQQLESAIEIMSNFSYKKEFESKKAIYNKFLRLYQCNTKNWPLQKNILSKLSLLLDYANQQDNITQTLDIILGGDVVSSTPLDFIPFKERASSKSSYYGLIDEGLIKWGSSRSLDFILINDGLIKEGVSQPSLFNQDMSQESQELLYHIIKQEADAAKKTSSVFSPFDSNNSDIPVLVSRVLTFLIHILFNENINYETRDRALDILIEITLIDRKYMVVFVTDFGKEYNSFLQSESHGATLAFAEKIIKINSELEVGSVSMVDEWMNSGLGDLAFGALNLALTVIEKNPDFALDFVSIVYKGINFGSNMLKSMALKLAIKIIEKNAEPALDFVSIVYEGMNSGTNDLKSMALKLAIKIIEKNAEPALSFVSIFNEWMNSGNEYLRIEAFNLAATIMEKKPELVVNFVSMVNECMNSGDNHLKFEAFNLASIITEENPGLALDFVSMFNDGMNSGDNALKRGAFNLAATIVAKKPEPALDFVPRVNEGMNSDDYVVNCKALILASTIIEKNPGLALDFVSTVNVGMNVGCHGVVLEALRLASTIIEKNPGLASNFVSTVTVVIASSNDEVMHAVLNLASIIIEKNSELALDFVSMVDRWMNSGAKRYALILAATIIQNKPELGLDFISMVNEWMNSSDEYVKKSALALASVIIENKPALIVDHVSMVNEWMNFSDEYSKKSALALALIIIEKNPEFALDFVPMVNEWLNSCNNHLKFEAFNLASTIIEKNPGLALDFVSTINVGMASDNDKVMEAVLKLASVIIEKNPELASDFVSTVDVGMASGNGEVMHDVLKLALVIIEKNPDLARDFVTKANEGMNSRFEYVKKSALALALKIIEKIPELAQDFVSMVNEAMNFMVNEAMNFMVNEAMNFNDGMDIILNNFITLKEDALILASLIIEKKPELIVDFVSMVNEWLDSGNTYLKKRALELALKIIEKNPSLALAFVSRANEWMNSGQVGLVSNLINGLTLLEIANSKLHQRGDKPLRTAIFNSIPTKIASLKKEEVINNLTFIEAILSVIGFEPREMEENVKLSGASCKEFLESLLEDASLEKILSWINDSGEMTLSRKSAVFPESKPTSRFFKLLKLSSHTPVFFKQILHQVLERRTMNELEQSFILNCIQLGCTVSFRDEGERKEIIFEDKTYPIGTDYKSSASFKEIIKAALNQDGDVLTQQYINHEPIFPNVSDALPVALVDIKQNHSLIDRDKALSPEHYQLSLMQRSTHLKSIPEGHADLFILLETASYFGGADVYKISVSASGGGYQWSTQSYHLNASIPAEQDKYRKDREALFGSMTYKDLSKPRYYASHREISLRQGARLIHSLSQTSSLKVEVGQDNIQEQIAAMFSELLNRSLDDGAALSTQLGLSLPWSEYVRNKATKEYNKYSLLNLTEAEAESLRKESNAIKLEQKVDDHSGQLQDLQTRMKIVEDKIDGFAIKLGMSDIQIRSMKEALSKINPQASYDILKFVGDNMESLSSVIAKEKAERAQDAILSSILSQPYQAGFYHQLRSELNATFIAAKSVQTDIVENKRTGMMGDLGQIFKTLSAHVPVIGLGVQFFGGFLSLLDKSLQTKMVANYAHVVTDVSEMEALSKQLALALLSKEHILSREKLNQPDSLVKTCETILSTGIKTLAGRGDFDVSGLPSISDLDISKLLKITTNSIVNHQEQLTDNLEDAAEEKAAEGLSNKVLSSDGWPMDRQKTCTSFFSSFFKSKESLTLAQRLKQEDVNQQKREKREGEKHASLVATLIISKIYSGHFGEHNVQRVLVNALIELVEGEYRQDAVMVPAVSPKEDEVKSEGFAAIYPAEDQFGGESGLAGRFKRLQA